MADEKDKDVAKSETIVEVPPPHMFGGGPFTDFRRVIDEDGTIHAIDNDGPMVVTVIPDPKRPGEADVRNRRAIETSFDGEIKATRTVLRADLNGVKVYVRKNSIIITTEKLPA